jgi:hypothetical protein
MNRLELVARAAERSAAIEAAALKALRLDAKTEGKLREQATMFAAALASSVSTVATIERLAPLRAFA